MDKFIFLKTLEYELGNIDADARADILADFREHFDVAMESGKDEHEICRVLGDPKEIAREFVTDYAKEQSARDAEPKVVHGNAPAPGVGRRNR